MWGPFSLVQYAIKFYFKQHINSNSEKLQECRTTKIQTPSKLTVLLEYIIRNWHHLTSKIVKLLYKAKITNSNISHTYSNRYWVPCEELSLSESARNSATTPDTEIVIPMQWTILYCALRNSRDNTTVVIVENPAKITYEYNYNIEYNSINLFTN